MPVPPDTAACGGVPDPGSYPLLLVDDAGLVDLDFAVPSDPALIGAQLHLQLVAYEAWSSPIALSNLRMAGFF